MTEHHEQPPQTYESDLMFRSRKQRKQDEEREQIRRDLAEQDARDAAASAGAIFSSHDGPQYVTTTASAFAPGEKPLVVQLDQRTVDSLADSLRLPLEELLSLKRTFVAGEGWVRDTRPEPRTVPAVAFYVVLAVACALAAAFLIAVLL